MCILNINHHYWQNHHIKKNNLREVTMLKLSTCGVFSMNSVITIVLPKHKDPTNRGPSVEMPEPVQAILIQTNTDYYSFKG